MLPIALSHTFNEENSNSICKNKSYKWVHFWKKTQDTVTGGCLGFMEIRRDCLQFYMYLHSLGSSDNVISAREMLIFPLSECSNQGTMHVIY
jgi:hypothetical protein